MEIHDYYVDIKWDSGKIGTLSSADLDNSVVVATPPEFSGGVPRIWSPEHFFTASVLSCFMTTFLAIAEYSKFEFMDFKCGAKGVLEKPDGKYAMTKVILKAELTISDPSDSDKAIRLLEKSEKACLISNSIKSETLLESKIIIQSKLIKA
ncbi:MAG: OsmC family protein [Saprospiraceae bacterium]|nr:OsmC family protein [Saprospiraceae bacterium]